MVRSGDTCPGTELPLSCAAGQAAGRSFLDLDLESGDYYVQVDGYGGDAGGLVAGRICHTGLDLKVTIATGG